MMNELDMYNALTDAYIFAANKARDLLWDYVTMYVDYEEIAKWEAVRDRAKAMASVISSNPDFIPF